MDCPRKCEHPTSAKLVDITCKEKKNVKPFKQKVLIEAMKYIPTKWLTHKVLKDVTTQCSDWNKKTSSTHAEIRSYMDDYQIDWTEAEKCRNSESVDECVDAFETKNEFFQRALKPENIKIQFKRVKNVLVSPADCRLMAYENVKKATKFWVKGHGFSLEKLLGNVDMAKKYIGGSLVICRLAPDDYHRFHMPINCVYEGHHKIHGHYYSVDPRIVNSSIDVFGENKREVHRLYNEYFGTVLCVVVGATCTGSIEMEPSVKEGKKYTKGAPLGRFGFGGSTIIMVFEPHIKLELCEMFKDNSLHHVETYVRVGTKLASVGSHIK